MPICSRAAKIMACCLVLAGLAVSSVAHAQLALVGTVGQKAIVALNGEPPKTMSIGQENQGIKLIAVQSNQATFSIRAPSGETRQTSIRVGQVPVSLTSSEATGTPNTAIVLTAGNGGHYFPAGFINNKAANFMLDTGATDIAMGMADAKRLGVRIDERRRARVNTANGSIIVYQVTLDSVRIQGVELRNVEAGVSDGPGMSHILLGNSFLNRFDITRTHDKMVLRRRY